FLSLSMPSIPIIDLISQSYNGNVTQNVFLSFTHTSQVWYKHTYLFLTRNSSRLECGLLSFSEKKERKKEICYAIY
ncbi:hypothetical protein COCVIDRAFT_83994, partial [Bipolaris victoriae FI3]